MTEHTPSELSAKEVCQVLREVTLGSRSAGMRCTPATTLLMSMAGILRCTTTAMSLITARNAKYPTVDAGRLIQVIVMELIRLLFYPLGSIKALSGF